MTISSALKADGSLLYFLCDDGVVKSFNTTTQAVSTVADTAMPNTYSLAYDPTGNGKIYVAEGFGTGLKKIDLSDSSVATIAVNNIGINAAGTVAVRKNGRKVYVGDGGGKLHIIDAANTAAQTEIDLATLTTGSTAIGGLGIYANDAALYAVMTDGTTHVIDVETNQVTKTIAAASGTAMYMIWGDFLGNVQATAAPGTNAAPTANAVAITGTSQVGVQLTGGYTYADAESDAEGTSTFRWVRNAANTGVDGGTDVATTQNYTAAALDQGKYLYFCVTPVAIAGNTTGTQACSVASAAVAAAPVNGACATVAPTAFAPSANLCTSGSAAAVSLSGSN
jgi:hypothetical protein